MKILFIQIIFFILISVAVWRALKAEGIEMPYPHRVIEMRDNRGPGT